MADEELPPPAPTGPWLPDPPEPPPPGDRRHLEAYRHRDSTWADAIPAADCFASHPDLALALPGTHPRHARPPSRRVRWIINGLIVAATLAIIATRDWSLWRWFRPVTVARRLELNPEPATRVPGTVSALTRARVDAINGAVERRDWEYAAQSARQLMEDPLSGPELRRDPAAWSWLGDTAVSAAVNAGDLLDGEARRQRYREAVQAYETLLAEGTTPGLLAGYGHAVARFYLQGGPTLPDTALDPAALEQAADLLNAIGSLRQRFGPELANSRIVEDRLLLVEGWTLARRLCESGRNPIFARFDRTKTDNQLRWQRLALLLDQGAARLAAERDFLRLQLAFWEIADSFCFNPLSNSETVRVGTWTAVESDIEARIARLRTDLGLPR